MAPTLGNNHKHWFCAKFFQQYRLFFRYHLERVRLFCDDIFC
ncbi:MAG: type II toxin-antitoxin system YhaV family toxin [Deltaproteobacteria bacterium]|nr:type II toxin-antitoxin system YhaV family toxin [Deltaproteobacteria bacterium]